MQCPDLQCDKMATQAETPSPGPSQKGESHQGNGENQGTLANLASSLEACTITCERKTSLMQLYHIFNKLDIKSRTVQYFEKPNRNGMEGIFCKNLFLKDRKGQFYLIICHEDTDVDLKKLKVAIHAHRNFNFGTANDLSKLLGLTPGAVSPFGLINDKQNSVKFIVESALAQSNGQMLNFHPVVDFLTTLISFDDLMEFVEYTGHSPQFVDM